MKTSLAEVISKLQTYIESENYQGYDPYDTLNSWIPFGIIGKWGKPIAIQIQKRNPINIRPLIGIHKGYNPKAIGLFLHAYSINYQQKPDEKIKAKMDFLFRWLIDNYTKGYSGYCWGYNFDWASSVKHLPAYSPTIVVSGFVAKGIRAYFDATQNPEALRVLESIADFMLKDLPQTEDQDGLCISYSTIEKDCCYNASLLGAELLAYLYSKNQNSNYKSIALKLADFVLKKQKPDGSWNYSIKLETGKERTQIDFHQGYVLDSLAYVMKYIPESEPQIKDIWDKGMDFYAQFQFTDQGRSIYRYPSVWPVDTHNQAQGVISFSRWARNNSDLELAQKIATYSIDKMRSPKGYFHYKKYPWISIKTPFMRWSQAWMFLALQELRLKVEDKL